MRRILTAAIVLGSAEVPIRQILQNVQSASTQALQAHENGEQAILKAVTAAHSLADLHPATSGSTQAGTDPAATAQIASRL